MISWAAALSIGNWSGTAAQIIPTTDLYFLNVCRPWLRRFPFHTRPIVQEGPNSFSCGKVAIVARRDNETVVQRLLQSHIGQLYYIIDDDLWAAEEDHSLPQAYRQRLIALREGQHRVLCERADTIVVSSPILADIYQSKGYDVVSLPPYWPEPLPDSRHFSDLAKGEPLEIGYLGSASHAEDRAFTFQVFEQLARRGINMRLTVIGSADVPVHLADHHQLRILNPLNWHKHRKRLAKLRFHVALYPTMPTAFNKARSINKILEHAVYGSLGLYSRTWFYADLIEKNDIGLVLNNNIAEWTDAIGKLAENGLDRRYKKSREALEQLNARSMRKQFDWWHGVLDLTPRSCTA
ncbi:hypothetical protein [Roseibium polysiphoniae]|uniref:Glycosyltransferase family 1 protein n=1 Tax=Roseibium polysiphoniae TaxID=2571221 RepID=A0ABR9C9T1_9HYPH|nr:hypothetical protein [Roseibium polysiphoniae]MBD8876661.1 hypothetical protein [Roseibium polysiphoniae]